MQMQSQQQQQQQQPGTPAPPYYNQAYSAGQQPVAMNEGEYGYSETMMKKPEPVVYPVQQQHPGSEVV